MLDSEYQILQPDVKTAARTVARNWEGVIEAEDAEQDIWVHLLERPNSITLLVGMDRPARVSALNMIGQQIGSAERDDYEVYSGNFSYSTDEIRDLLESGAMDRSSDFVRPDSETVTEMIDLQLAVQALANNSSNQYASLFDRYVLGNSAPDKTVQKRVERAVDALTREMNRVNLRRRMAHDDGPGSRRAVSNERASALTTTDYTSDLGEGRR